MDERWRWVYVYEAHVVGIGKPHVRLGSDDIDGWEVVVLPDWMSQAFVNRLTPEAMGTSDPIHCVMIVVPETMLIMGEPVRSFERIDNWKPRYTDNRYSRIQRLIPPTPEERMANIRILLDGVLIWGAEEYPGERQIVMPRVKIPKKLREGLPMLEGGEA